MPEEVINRNEEKNRFLQKTRGVSFEEVKIIIEEGKTIDILENPNYKNQYILIVKIYDYIYSVPCLISEKEIFLKTIYPNRKFNKIYKNI